MTEDIALIEKREELKRRLAADEYKRLYDVILGRTGRLIQKITRSPKPPSFWYSAVVIALVTLLIGFLTSILLGEVTPARREIIPVELWLVGLALTSTIAYKIYYQIIITMLHDDLLDAIESVEDLADLERWFAAVSNVKTSLFTGLVVAFFSVWLLFILVAILRG